MTHPLPGISLRAPQKIESNPRTDEGVDRDVLVFLRGQRTVRSGTKILQERKGPSQLLHTFPFVLIQCLLQFDEYGYISVFILQTNR